MLRVSLLTYCSFVSGIDVLFSLGTGSATDDTEKAKKVGFMTKMKGEAKILLGKVEGKKGHDKVEEGQKIKAGEATTAQ